MLDAQRAIRMTRFFANDWNIDKNKIGILGSSAGGHLASTAATHLDEVLPKADDSTDFVSARPDFMILLYPVITFKQPAKHAGSEYALLGDSPDSALVRHFSNELQVNDNTPPTFSFMRLMIKLCL